MLQSQQPSLPQLIKQSTTYKLKVPQAVEEKIRYLIRKFPDTEWSGVLFYTHTGSFEGEDLVIECKDIFPMDLGTGTFTSFKLDESVGGYIAMNIDLFTCETGLIHSHHHMGAFFSGTDTATLRSEGNDTNCFVSLIVDTKGTYQAAITRKVKQKTEIITKTAGMSYEFFGEGSVQVATPHEFTKQFDEEIIQYFMLDVEIEQVSNPLEYLDERFIEIEEAKRKATPVQRVYNPSKGDTEVKYLSPLVRDEQRAAKKLTPDKDDEFFDWLHSNRKQPTESYHQPSIFGEEVMEEMVDITKWQPDPTIIHYLCCQLLTCSLIVNKDIDLKQWVTRHMQKKYDEIFSGEENHEFDMWSDSYVEFIINHYSDENIPADVYEDWDTYQSKIAEAILDEIAEFPTNSYIEGYSTTLTHYINVDL